MNKALAVGVLALVVSGIFGAAPAMASAGLPLQPAQPESIVESPAGQPVSTPQGIAGLLGSLSAEGPWDGGIDF
ncbi:hypothetical protein [Nocardia rhizosphaerae]|uniref:Secreted protein n=1 Tax=Nocardia rhizosphaerae TaxID=1691571 RepID=A0ABV8L6E5_9NOCA